MRLDKELIERGIYITRTRAQAAIKDGIIKCDEKIVTKSSFEVTKDTVIEKCGEDIPYVSRGGLKLEKAIKEFKITLDDRIMLDIGSSTGGFTDCALKNGIRKVIAVDVGSDQMSEELRYNLKVELHENTDIRNMDVKTLCDVTFATIDVSFISVIKIASIFEKIENVKEIMCLIKPQFECGKDIAKKYNGIIKNKDVHEKVIKDIIEEMNKLGYYIDNLSFSPIKGGSGNIEYLGYFIKDNIKLNAQNDNKIDRERIKECIKDAENRLKNNKE